MEPFNFVRLQFPFIVSYITFYRNKGHRSRKKAKERREEEERIVARERALQDDDAAPETDGDFERLLIATPNDSFLWVKYMAFKLSLADVDVSGKYRTPYTANIARVA